MRWSRQMRSWPKERPLSGVVPSVNQIITSSGRSGLDPMVRPAQMVNRERTFRSRAAVQLGGLTVAVDVSDSDVGPGAACPLRAR